VGAENEAPGCKGPDAQGNCEEDSARGLGVLPTVHGNDAARRSWGPLPTVHGSTSPAWSSGVLPTGEGKDSACAEPPRGVELVSSSYGRMVKLSRRRVRMFFLRWGKPIHPRGRRVSVVGFSKGGGVRLPQGRRVGVVGSPKGAGFKSPRAGGDQGSLHRGPLIPCEPLRINDLAHAVPQMCAMGVVNRVETTEMHHPGAYIPAAPAALRAPEAASRIGISSLGATIKLQGRQPARSWCSLPWGEPSNSSRASGEPRGRKLVPFSLGQGVNVTRRCRGVVSFSKGQGIGRPPASRQGVALSGTGCRLLEIRIGGTPPGGVAERGTSRYPLTFLRYFLRSPDPRPIPQGAPLKISAGKSKGSPRYLLRYPLVRTRIIQERLSQLVAWLPG
jgi:hypothetical protein